MSSRRAFTLIEMLVALAVTSVLTVMMLRMFTDSSAIWQREDQRLETFRESRAALQLITRELATLLPLPSTTAATATPAPGGTPAPTPVPFPVLALRTRTARPANSSPKEHFTSAYALTAVPNSGGSDLCATGYFLEWDNGGGDQTTGSVGPRPAAYRLKRQFGESNNTFTRLRTALNVSSPKLGEAAFKTLYDPTSAPALSDDATQVLATYIWDLQFAIPDPTTTTTGTTTATKLPDNVYYGNDLPQWIEVRFRALGATSARKLQGQALSEAIWNDPSNPTYERLIRPGEQQFVSRIKLTR